MSFFIAFSLKISYSINRKDDKMKKILVSAMLCLSLFLMTGCGSDKLKGTWGNAKDDELKATFEFNGSGKVTYKNQFISEREGNYTIEDNKVTIKDVWDDEKVYEFVIKDNKLSLTATDSYSPSYKDLNKE